MHESSELTRHVQTVESFLSSVPVDQTGTIPEFLAALMEMRARLRRPGLQVTLLGAVKTGKSSLLNALLGTRLVPVRAHRTLPTVTAIEYCPEPKAALARHGKDAEEVPIDALRDMEWNVDDLTAAEELRLTVPLPFLANGAMLVDTPGLLESDKLDEIANKELFKSDLVVLVLAADKILSAGERDFVAWANDLLHGNIIFVVNRMDLIDEEDRDDVVEWARSALRDVGNDLAGHARIFATSAVSAAAASAPGTEYLRAWLANFLTSELSDRAAMVSRLGILEHHLHAVAAHVRQERARAESEESDARQRYLARIMTERAAAHRALSEGRVRLRAVQERLPSLGDALVTRCLEDARQNLSRLGDEELRAIFRAALDEYAEAVRDQVSSALSGVPVTPVAFQHSDWIFRTRLDPVTDPARELGVTLGDALTKILDGGRAGREAGATIGGWIGKNVLGIDATREALRRIDAVARGTVAPVQAEAESYLTQIFGLLDEADAEVMTRTPTSADVEEAERNTRYWAALGTWCDGFLRAVRLATAEGLSACGGDRS